MMSSYLTKYFNFFSYARCSDKACNILLDVLLFAWLINRKENMIIYNPSRKIGSIKQIQFFDSDLQMQKFFMQYRNTYANWEQVKTPEGFALSWSGRASDKTRGKVIEL